MSTDTAGTTVIWHPEITDEAIFGLVSAFYGRARTDDLLGPVFAAAVHDWDRHIADIADFWSSVMLRTARYQGRPLRPHLQLPLTASHFDRWLALFEETARARFSEEAAMGFIDRARRIADSFQMSIASHRGELYTPRHTPITRRRPLAD